MTSSRPSAGTWKFSFFSICLVLSGWYNRMKLGGLGFCQFFSKYIFMILSGKQLTFGSNSLISKAECAVSSPTHSLIFNQVPSGFESGSLLFQWTWSWLNLIRNKWMYRSRHCIFCFADEAITAECRLFTYLPIYLFFKFFAVLLPLTN